MTNLRGSDINYNPVFFAYALFYPKRPSTESRLTLFIEASKVEGNMDYLSSQKIEVQPYDSISTQLLAYDYTGFKVCVHFN